MNHPSPKNELPASSLPGSVDNPPAAHAQIPVQVKPYTMSFDNPQSICEQGETALLSGQNHLAFKLYQEGVRLFPTYAELWRRLGSVALRCGDIVTARKALLKANEWMLQQQTGCEMPFFKQAVPITCIHDRSDLLRELCTGKKVLHIGCTDYPLFNPKTNLHIQLSQICSSLDGLDIDVVGLHELHTHYPGRYFSDHLEAIDDYDLLLIPETLEHVDNISCFLTSLQHLRFKKCLITAPNAFQHNDYGNYWLENGVYIEHTHPDHNNWFSPYTLGNCIRKFTTWNVVETFLLNDQQMVGCLCEKNSP
jgi:hypothetical protein